MVVRNGRRAAGDLRGSARRAGGCRCGARRPATPRRVVDGGAHRARQGAGAGASVGASSPGHHPTAGMRAVARWLLPAGDGAAVAVAEPATTPRGGEAGVRAIGCVGDPRNLRQRAPAAGS
eukprot:7061576-Prymnesium_polylepis.1